MPIPPEHTTIKARASYAAIEALKALSAFSRETAKKGPIVFEKARQLFPELAAAPKQVTEEAFSYYLSYAVGDAQSPVNCEGPWKGYYYSEAAEKLADAIRKDAEEPPAEAEVVRKEKEKFLYPIVVRWLQGEGYRCDDTSALRSLGKWGNPDVTGLLVTEAFGAIDAEICTVEVKCGYENWEYSIFEAVAHRRWANRSYFALTLPEEFLLKLPRDLRYYSELYHIGILAILLETGTYEQLQAGNIQAPFTSENSIIQQLYSAPYQTVQPQHKKKFLEKGLGLTEIQKICSWGLAVDED